MSLIWFGSHFVVLLKSDLDVQQTHPEVGLLNILVGAKQHNKITSIILTLTVLNHVTPKAAAKHDLLFNKLASEHKLLLNKLKAEAGLLNKR